MKPEPITIAVCGVPGAAAQHPRVVQRAQVEELGIVGARDRQAGGLGARGEDAGS